jgi:molybdate transport system substrate-binding protein
MRVLMLITFSMFLPLTQTSSAQSTKLKVLASNGMKAVIEELRPELEVLRPLAMEFNTSVATRQRIEAGEAFDVTVLTTEVVNDLAKAGWVAKGSVVDLGRSGIGFGVRAGAAKPDVRTPEAVKKALLNAKSMTWVAAGASRAHIDRMLEGLGIAADVKSKIQLTQAVDESLARVANGKAEMILTLTSEILPASGVQYVGPFPEKFQNYVSFSAGVGAKSSAPAAAALFIKRLTGLGVIRVYQAKGMELPVQGDVGRPPVLPPK